MGPSKTPTKLEREWMARVRDYGCIACRIDGQQRPASVHHITQGFRRLGHLFTIPLCEPGHHKDGAHLGFVSLHDAKRSFVERYGSELDLLARLKVELGVFDSAEYQA
jgi:hypothetical protein